MLEKAYFIKSLPFFHGLSDDAIQELVDCAHIRTYQKKTSIYNYGDPSTRFFVVVHGWVKLCQHTLEGNEAVLGLFTRGDSFGEAVLIDGAHYPQTAETIEETKVIELPASALRNLALKNPEFSIHLMQSMTNNLMRIQLENEHLSIMSTNQRIACFILQMCLRQEHFTGHTTFPYDKHIAAAKLGMTAETFSRGLKELKAHGVDVKKNDIYITDMKSLEDFACSNCSCSPKNCILAGKGLCSGHTTNIKKAF